MVSHFSHVQLFATSWAAAHQAPLSMVFSRQEYHNGLPVPSPIKLLVTYTCLHFRNVSWRVNSILEIRTPLNACCTFPQKLVLKSSFKWDVCSIAQTCPTLCDSMDCGLPGSSIYADSQGKNIGVGCNFLPQGSNPMSPALAGWFFTTEPPGKPSSGIPGHYLITCLQKDRRCYSHTAWVRALDHRMVVGGGLPPTVGPQMRKLFSVSEGGLFMEPGVPWAEWTCRPFFPTLPFPSLPSKSPWWSWNQDIDLICTLAVFSLLAALMTPIDQGCLSITEMGSSQGLRLESSRSRSHKIWCLVGPSARWVLTSGKGRGNSLESLLYKSTHPIYEGSAPMS